MKAGDRHTFLSPFEYAGEVLIATINNRPCTIVRELDEGEVDRDEVGRMYVVRFDDGTEAHAYEDELNGEIVRNNPGLFPVYLGGTA